MDCFIQTKQKVFQVQHLAQLNGEKSKWKKI